MQDAHNHLQDKRLDGIRDAAVTQMRATGITCCVVNGTSPDDWPAVAALAKRYPDFVIPSFGLHPWKKPTSGWLETLVELLDTTPGACIGECGLDRWMRGYDMELQTDIFCSHLSLAAERNLPLSIHCLRAWGHLVELLESRPLPARGFLLHSYGGSAELVPRLARLGAYFSFSGHFLHPRKQAVRDAFQKVPTDRLLLETDAPDMLPPPPAVRFPLPENTNHPGNLTGIRHQAAKFLDISMTGENFWHFFEKDVDAGINDAIFDA